jgi:hypothetical protein
MTIYDIKRLTQETAPYFFVPKTMKFFGQRVADFKVYKQHDGRYKIIAPIKDLRTGKVMGQSIRFFNPVNNELEHS